MDSEVSIINDTLSRSSISSLISILEENDISYNSELPHTNLDSPLTRSGSSSVLDSEISGVETTSIDRSLTELVYNAENLDLNDNCNHSKANGDISFGDRNIKDDFQLLNKEEGGEYHPEDLTAWEKWVINKAKQRRMFLKKKKKESLLNSEREKSEKKLKEERKKKFDELFSIKVKEWNRNLARSSLMTCASEKSFKAISMDKINENFKKWMEEKSKKSRDAVKKEKAADRSKIVNEKEKLKKARESYESWLEKTKDRTGRQSRSETIINDYVLGSYPEPSYVNPNPWNFQ